ncbi:uncharacterized protein LOC129566635 isoform X2 [Sitodiplosis mosellana]|uniref:uncharacterized protein LOC129566635 isoform X2 n=1 Tax=Sitodiplosis mosellana TaxID=263140 RepID=UPI00244480C5|nr:uncharacterized protein LOC129566635 isoform X2 [Sitodiplosis mosellana]
MDVDKRKLGTCIVRQCLLVVLISSFGASVKFGLISPIEVVEEWGCQDTEIRLTCSNLDSTIAILEATFKPNCSLSGRNSSSRNATDENCVQFDLKRLTPKPVPRLDETVAARRLLEVLRRSHKKEDDRTEPTVQTVKTASFDFGLKPKDDVNDLKRKRLTLRASLESLLVEYLRGFAPNDDDGFADDRSRVKRSAAATGLQNNDDQNRNENSDAENVNSSNVREDENRVRNNYSDKNTNEFDVVADDRANRTTNASRSFCPERRQRITQLDRNELTKAIQNISEHEHNIRSLLNYRCSGKNHCSFVFNEDHPFSVLWPYGIVHIKYICMERYRLNKFCGEHLVVVNEVPELEPEEPDDMPQQRSLPNENDVERVPSGLREENRDGPIAEALIQNEQMFHHLKILKPSPSEIENERRKSALVTEKIDKPRKGVYSQDFRVMKVLPAHLDDFNDIEKIADEFYFKKEEEEVENEDIINSENSMHTKTTTTTVGSTEPTVYTSHINPIEHADNTKSIIENTVFDSSNNGLRDVRSTLGYDEMHNHKHLSSLVPTMQTSETAATHTQQQTTVNLWNNELLPPNVNIFETVPIDSGSNDIFAPNENQTNGQSNAKIRIENEFTVINTNRADVGEKESIEESEEDYDASYEDDVVEVTGPKVWRKNNHRAHTSYQKTAIRQPLLQQGFIASPGYPKYYVGNSNCSWRITVTSGQRIRLVLLDVNLRYDPVCKDYLQIVDVENRIMLYKNCTEIVKPLEILSESNELQIAIRTTSALAYPKRGILIYYTEHASVKVKKDDPYVTQLWKQSRPGAKPDQADPLFDILIPLLIMVGLFVGNALILLVIWRYRKKRKNQQEEEGLARL